MKLKSTLWALALAFAAVSCSDDLENGPGNGTDESNRQKAYMTINISTVSDGVMTKADPSNPNNNEDGTTAGAGWGEDGNGWLGELTDKEGTVYDINIFLVETTKTTLTKDDHLDLLNTDNTKDLDASFAGTAYKELDDPLNASPNNGNEANHGSRNVTVTMRKDLTEEGEKFQVFTIINAGVDLSKTIHTLRELRDYVQKGGENSVIREYENNDMKKADKFIMSTHRMCSTGTNEPSIVILSTEHTAEHPAATSVYVERLAARIDLAYPTKDGVEGILEFNNDASPVNNKGTFKLTGYMVVNQWKGGTYMFKQVTPCVENEDGELMENAEPGSDDPLKYLGDEVWNDNKNNKYNFVNSLCFWEKNTSNLNDKDGSWNYENKTEGNQAYYDNYFSTNLNNNKLVNPLPTGDLKYQESNTDPTFFPIAYVRENTMNTKQQVNGFSTGVIFRTQFEPNAEFKMMKYNENNGKIEEVTLEDIKEVTLESTSINRFQFLTAEHYNAAENKVQKLVYADVKTVAARAFNLANNNDKGMMQGFMKQNSWSSNSIATLADVEDAINKMSQKNKLSVSFKSYLLKELAKITVDKSTVMKDVTGKENLTYDSFVTKEGAKGNLLKLPLAEYKASDIANLADWYGIFYFRDGQSYHKFWIRHDDNGKDNKMAVMEFAIVRNNVYQLNVKGVSGLGDPLPFVPGKDDPDTPDENNKVTIDVTIFVKDWVKRRNKDITLK